MRKIYHYIGHNFLLKNQAAYAAERLFFLTASRIVRRLFASGSYFISAFCRSLMPFFPVVFSSEHDYQHNRH